MRVKILLFAQLKEAHGSGELWLEIPASAMIRDAIDVVMTKYNLHQFRNLPLRYAVNEEFQSEDTMLCENDCLALLSPVAGG